MRAMQEYLNAALNFLNQPQNRLTAPPQAVSDGRQSLTMQRGGIDPVVGTWPTGKPMLASEYQAIKEGSLNLFNSLSNIVPAGPKVPQQVMAMRRNSLYPIPSRDPRPFSADYKKGAVGNVGDKLQFDIDGRPITAPMVAGRNTVGGSDVGWDAASIERLGTEAGGARFLDVPLSNADGRISWNPKSGGWGNNDLRIELSNKLSEPQRGLAASHEVSHFVDEAAGQVSLSKVPKKELELMYHRQATGREYGGPKNDILETPQRNGYKGEDVSREYAAEAIRAYLADPNYLKSVSPNAAKVIRAAVNSDPYLSKWVQFNTAAGMLGGGAAVANRLTGGDDGTSPKQ